MKHNNALLEKLTRSSLRLNKGMTILLAVALLLVGTSIWSIQRLIEKHEDMISIHFARVMENIKEQEAFLTTLTEYSRKGDLSNALRLPFHVLTPLPEEGPDIYWGQAYSFSLPFSVKFDDQQIAVSEHEKIFGLGANLASFYSAYWSASFYQSPQVFLFDRQNNYDIAVPASGRGRGKETADQDNFIDVIGTVAARVPRSRPNLTSSKIVWRSYAEAPSSTTPARLLAYTGIQLMSEQVQIKGAGAYIVVASLVDLTQINDFERIMEWKVYDRFSLVDPSGNALIGVLRPESPLHEGVNLNAEGLVFKLINHSGPRWSAIYTITYKSFFHYAFWSLTSLIAFALLFVSLALVASRWYKKQVILPARKAHASIAESEAFSRVVIDTAPTGLCVVRSSDHEVLLENQRAQQWHGTAELIRTHSPQQDSAETGEHHLLINGRHLQVGFVSTRYQGQDVKLYAFNDVTCHVEDAKELEEARRAADAANEAKTLFLATMSHEIRTPLYGVLGTLELLGRTHLDSRQQAYLQTIQRSSATLFQLISDVLDVSKIESEQMAIEPVEFCPLDMLEDTLRTYCAFAERKGLQLFACTDAKLPDRVVGDQMRIRQILNNLLSNAIKFTESGRVVLRTRVLALTEDEVSLEWQVTDTGIGIPEAQQAKLFGLFYQVRETVSEGSAGLGLPICWSLSEMMGGQMRVVSEPGLGSSFTLKIKLPVPPGERLECPAIALDQAPVYIRAPERELAQSYCDWLKRLGIAATLTVPPQEQTDADAVLVDVLPAATEYAWSGQRILCTNGGGNCTEYIDGCWRVDMHDVRAIARTISRARRGHTLPVDQAPEPDYTNLQLSILVAEDNPINQAILKEQLEALGCTVLVAANGEQALRLWQPKVFDLVLTDINMPVMNGYELAKTLRERDAQLPIIGVTANAMREEGARCIEMGMSAWVVKPLSLQTLRAHLTRLCKPPLQSASPRIRPEDNSAISLSSQNDSVILPATMKELFVTTMQQEMQSLRVAVEQRDTSVVGERLHSIAGALGTVQAASLAEHCRELEDLLGSTPLDESMSRKVQQVLCRLSAILGKLE